MKESPMSSMRWKVLGGSLLFALALRILPYILGRMGLSIRPDITVYPWNFSPVMAVCLLLGSGVWDRRWAWVLAWGMMFVSDLSIGWLAGDLRFAVYATMPVIYACLGVGVWLGTRIGSRRTLLRVGSRALLAEGVFFLVTNLAVWVLSETTYTHDGAGLLACYVAAIPFFGRSVAGTLVYCSVLFPILNWGEQMDLSRGTARKPATVTA